MAAGISAARTFRNEPRRSFSTQYKRELVEMVLASPTSLARLAREHDLNQNQLTKWRREYEQGVKRIGNLSHLARISAK
jgi:transposase